MMLKPASPVGEGSVAARGHGELGSGRREGGVDGERRERGWESVERLRPLLNVQPAEPVGEAAEGRLGKDRKGRAVQQWVPEPTGCDHRRWAEGCRARR